MVGKPHHLRQPYTGEIPALTMESLERYLDAGQPPGGFMRRVLENEPVMVVVGHGDEAHQRALGAICKWIYNELPIAAWGSETKVSAWIAHRGKEGAAW